MKQELQTQMPSESDRKQESETKDFISHSAAASMSFMLENVPLAPNPWAKCKTNVGLNKNSGFLS